MFPKCFLICAHTQHMLKTQTLQPESKKCSRNFPKTFLRPGRNFALATMFPHLRRPLVSITFEYHEKLSFCKVNSHWDCFSKYQRTELWLAFLCVHSLLGPVPVLHSYIKTFCCSPSSIIYLEKYEVEDCLIQKSPIPPQ